MANCQACGAPITWAQVKEEDRRVPLDTILAGEGEDGRYRIVDTMVDDGVSRPIVLSVAKEYGGGETYRDHRQVCVNAVREA